MASIEPESIGYWDEDNLGRAFGQAPGHPGARCPGGTT